MPHSTASGPHWSRFDSRESDDGWRIAMEERIINVDVKPIGDGPMYAAIEMVDLGAISVISFDMSPLAMGRARRHMGDGHDGFALSVATTQHLDARQAGSEFSLTPGEAVLMDARSPSDLAGRAGASFLGFRISRHWFSRFGLAAPEGAAMVSASAPLGLLSTYARRMAAAIELERFGLSTMFESHVGELLAASLIAGGAMASGDPAAVGDMRYRFVIETLRVRASDHGLTLPVFARAVGMSERSVQETLWRRGATFSELLRGYRLALVMARLKRGERQVANIAFSSGFSDLTTFNRAFRAAYGVTPSEMIATVRVH